MPPAKKSVSKKDEKVVVNDVQFDTLVVESGHICTSILMLDSKEEEILIKAIDTISAFVDQDHYNKQQICEMGGLWPVVRLLKHENDVIRGKACQILASLTEHEAVVKWIKKSDDLIPTLLLMLAPTEDIAVQEHVCHCLSILSKFYVIKAQVLNNGGMEPLLRCLTSPKPDIQNYAAEAIVLLLDDYPGKKAVRELKGFPAILELLKSEYPVLQYNALLALQLSSTDAENRSVLRELGALALLVELIAQPELSDLHILSCLILNTFVDDHETILLMASSGLLLKLMDLVMDTPPPPPPPPPPGKATKVSQKEQESKQKVETPRSGKKKDGSPRAESKKQKSAPEPAAVEEVIVEPFTPTLPGVKEYVGLAVERAAQNPDSRKCLREQDVERMLIQLLCFNNNKVKLASCQAITAMAKNLVSKEVLGKGGAVERLVAIVRDMQGCHCVEPLCALAILTDDNEYNCRKLAKSEGVSALIAQLTDNDEQILFYTLVILCHLACIEDIKKDVLTCGLIPALIHSLTSECLQVQCQAVQTVQYFVSKKEHRQQLMEYGGIRPIINMLICCESAEVRLSATSALIALIVDSKMAQEIIELGGLETLRDVQLTENLRNSLTDTALGKVLDNNLPAKYALLGYLCATDCMPDVFYDVGPVPCGTAFCPLNEYYKAPVSDRRPVLLAAFQREGSCCPMPECAPCDEKLVEYICELTEIMKEITCRAERACVLAKYVACKMGGAVDKCGLVHFCWELPMSKLKYRIGRNVIPLGQITMGIHYHRALLFKVLGDQVGVDSLLVRGVGHRAWNEILLADNKDEDSIGKFPPKAFVVDLMHEPGKLMSACSSDAVNYKNC